jgi:nucleotide-binding universal stress UspA family protein
MNQRILIAYDGSSSSDDALTDLKRAGLPSEAECLVLTVADFWPPPAAGTDEAAFIGWSRDPQLFEVTKSMLVDATATAARAAQFMRNAFPKWKVQSEAATDSPAWGILKRSDEWRADLIVVGSHGMSFADRIVVGSVSQRVISHAYTSVRVARPPVDSNREAIRLIVGFDGSTDAAAAIRQVVSRSWPPETEVRVITAVDHRLRTAIAAKVLGARPGFNFAGASDSELLQGVKDATEPLRAANLNSTCGLEDGDPTQALLRAARQWQADCVFVGATGLRGLRRLLLGSVSSAVTSHAPCTVEIVRGA